MLRPQFLHQAREAKNMTLKSPHSLIQVNFIRTIYLPNN